MQKLMVQLTIPIFTKKPLDITQKKTDTEYNLWLQKRKLKTKVVDRKD